MKWKLWQSAKQKEKADKQKALTEKALESQKALERAATGTMLLAQDVTVTLQAKIDDYASQIDSTSRLLTDALLLVNDKGIIESFNPAAEQIFGWKKRDVIDQSITKLFKFEGETPVIDLEFMEKFCTQVNNDELSVSAVKYEDFMGICSNGSLLYIDVSASRLVRSDKKMYYLILVRDVTKRVENEQYTTKLANKNEELVIAINSSNTGIVILEPKDNEFSVAFVNKGFERMTGSTRQELLHSTLRCLLGVDSGYWAIRKCLNEGKTCRHEIQLNCAGMNKLWVDVHVTPVFKDRKLKQWIMVFYDTTELKSAYEDLRKSEQHFRAFGEASSEALVIHGENKVLDWNPRLVDMTGYSDVEISQMSPLDLVHPLERENIREVAMSTESLQYETLWMTKEGDVLEVAVNSQQIDWENTQARISVVRDVTQFKDVEHQLRASRERYRTIIDNTIDLVCCFDQDLSITFTNQTFRDYFECEDVVGYNLLEIIPEEDQDNFKKYLTSITPETPVRRGIHRIVRGEEVRWTDWIDRGIFAEDGTLIEFQSVCRDITHLMQSK